MTIDRHANDRYRPLLDIRPDTPWGNGRPEDEPERQLLVVLLDVSASMAMGGAAAGERPIDELNGAFREFLAPGGVQNSDLGRTGELGIAVFHSSSNTPMISWLPLGRKVHEDSPLYWVRYVKPFNNLHASGGTPLGAAVCEALDVIERRRKEWREDNIKPNPRPVLVTLTDGQPTDDISDAARRVHELEDSQDLLSWIAYTKNADPTKIAALADKGNAVPLGDKKIASFIQLLSLSVRTAANFRSRTAAEVYLSLLTKWGEA
jgi:uncharacterized protein YegL